MFLSIFDHALRIDNLYNYNVWAKKYTLGAWSLKCRSKISKFWKLPKMSRVQILNKLKSPYDGLFFPLFCVRAHPQCLRWLSQFRQPVFKKLIVLICPPTKCKIETINVSKIRMMNSKGMSSQGSVMRFPRSHRLYASCVE